MHNKKIAVYLCTGLLLATVGCSRSNADSDASTEDTIIFNDVIDSNAGADNSSLQSDKESDEQSNIQNSSGETTDDPSDDSLANDNSQQNNDQDVVQQADTTQLQADSAQPQSENGQLQSDSELDGSIESIGDNRVVINKTFHPSANTAVSYGDSDKVLVTVYFSEKTEFEVWTVKNGGVNGDADIEKRQGSFSDLKQGVNLNLTGDYEGDDFHAEHVIIFDYV